MKYSSISEDELRSSFLIAYDNTTNKKLYLEVPVFSRSVDLVVQDVSEESITAIEFKIDNWKRALIQAQSVALCFDYLFICIPKPKTINGSVNVVQACTESSIGLYFFDYITQTFEMIIECPKKKSIWKTQQSRVINYLEARNNERNAKNS